MIARCEVLLIRKVAINRYQNILAARRTQRKSGTSLVSTEIFRNKTLEKRLRWSAFALLSLPDVIDFAVFS